MSLDLVLNELSLQPASSVIDARNRMQVLLETIRVASSYRITKTIRSDRDINDINLAPHYPVRRWRNDQDVDREARRYFLSLTSKSPFLAGEPLATARACGIDAFYVGERIHGLLAAYLLDTLAVSLCSDPIWEEPFVTIDIDELTDSDIQRSTERVYHASLPVHIKQHETWLKERTALPLPKDGRELWHQRTERYSFLLFCNTVEDQLRRYLSGSQEIIQIMSKLADLNNYVKYWNSGNFDASQLKSHTTPESPETLRQFAQERTFTCPDGIERIFSWHMRFTPGAGRLYFHPDNETRTITIGYIGTHLSTVRFRT